MKNRRLNRIIAIVLCVMMLAPGAAFADAVGSPEIKKPEKAFQTRITSNWGIGKSRLIDYYYTDDYFGLDTSEYNPHFASCSMALAISAGSSEHSFIRKSLEDIGCIDICDYEYGNDNTYKSVGFAIGKKTLQDGTLLVPVMLRGFNYTFEWGMNFLAGLSGNALGYDWPANKVYSVVRKYIGKTKNVKIWISGYGRGGAVGNLLARKLSNYYGKSKVYTYCFDAPMTDNNASAKYTNIHNIQNKNDGITLVLPEYMGFGRNGNKTRYINDFEDALFAEKQMINFMKEYTPNYESQYKSPIGMNWHKLVINLDFASVNSLIQSVKNLVKGGKFYEFQTENSICDPELVWNDLIKKIKKVVPTRKEYVTSGMETGLANLAVLYESLEPGQINKLKASVKDKKTLLKLATNLNLVEAAISIQRGKMPPLTKAQYKCIAKTIYSAFIENSDFTDEQKNMARKVINNLVKPIFRLLAVDYRSEHQILGTLIQDDNLDRLIQCHYYDVNMAYMMMQDSFYADPE